MWVRFRKQKFLITVRELKCMFRFRELSTWLGLGTNILVRFRQLKCMVKFMELKY